MLSEKLHKLDDVNPADIVARLWEIIRCKWLIRISLPHVFFTDCRRPLPSLADRDCAR
jgi:hypothetical protein